MVQRTNLRTDLHVMYEFVFCCLHVFVFVNFHEFSSLFESFSLSLFG